MSNKTGHVHGNDLGFRSWIVEASHLSHAKLFPVVRVVFYVSSIVAVLLSHKHAERDTVIPILPVRLSVHPSV